MKVVQPPEKNPFVEAPFAAITTTSLLWYIFIRFAHLESEMFVRSFVQNSSSSMRFDEECLWTAHSWLFYRFRHRLVSSLNFMDMFSFKPFHCSTYPVPVSTKTSLRLSCIWLQPALIKSNCLPCPWLEKRQPQSMMLPPPCLIVNLWMWCVTFMIKLYIFAFQRKSSVLFWSHLTKPPSLKWLQFFKKILFL